jgi:hypothetical protein
MKMDNDVLLLSYLDKICLTLTGNLWRALASLYSEVRLCKGPRTATRPQSTYYIQLVEQAQSSGKVFWERHS